MVSIPEAGFSHVNFQQVPLHTGYDLGQSSDLDPEHLDSKVLAIVFMSVDALCLLRKKSKGLWTR